MNNIISEFLSNKIKRVSLLLAILVIMIHSYNIIDVNGKLTGIIFLEKFISQGISRIAVPMFFVLSGYLFFKDYKNTKEFYFNKLKKRIKTLVIPYFIWNLITYIIFTIPLYITPLQKYINGYNTQISILDFLQAIFLHKYNGTFWFMLYLIILNILSPLIYNILSNKKIGILFISILLSIWILYCNPIEGNIIIASLFFLIGSYISIHYFNILNRKRLLNNKELFFIFFIWILFIILYITRKYRYLFTNKYFCRYYSCLGKF